MNKPGFFAPSKKRTSDIKPGSGQREALANASERLFGRSPNAFASFNPVTTKTPASARKSFSFNRPKSTSFLASARFNRHSSSHPSGSTFLMASRVQSAPRFASTASNFDQECSAEEDEEEEESKASHSSDAQAQDAYKRASEERDACQRYLNSSDDPEPDFSNGNCTHSHSVDLSAFREKDEEQSKENSSSAKQPHDSVYGVLHVASMLEKYGASLRNSTAKRERDQEKHRKAIQEHLSTIDLLEREREFLKDELDKSVRAFDIKRSEQDVNLRNLQEEHQIALDDVSSLTKQNSALRSKSQSETNSFNAILHEKECEAAERSTLFKKTLEELSYLQTKLQDEAELKLAAKEEACNLQKQLHDEAELKLAVEQQASTARKKLQEALQETSNIEDKLDEALNELRISTETFSKERIVFKRQISDLEAQLRHKQGELNKEMKNRENLNSNSQKALAQVMEAEERGAALEDALEKALRCNQALSDEKIQLHTKVRSISQLLEQNAVQLRTEREIQEQQTAQRNETEQRHNHELAQTKNAIKNLEQRLERERDQWSEARQRQNHELTQKNDEIRLCKESYQHLKIERDELEQARERHDQALIQKTDEIRSLTDRLGSECNDRVQNHDILSRQLHDEKKNCADALDRLGKLQEERNRCEAEFAQEREELKTALSREQTAIRKIQNQYSAHQANLRQIATSEVRDGATIRKHVERIDQSGKKSRKEIAEARASLHTCRELITAIASLPRQKNEHIKEVNEEVRSRLKDFLIDYVNMKRKLGISKEEIEGATRVAHDAVMERDSLKRLLEVAENRLAEVEPAKVHLEREKAAREAEEPKPKVISLFDTPGESPRKLQRKRAQTNRKVETSAVQATGKPLLEAHTASQTRPRRKKAQMKRKAVASVVQANDNTLLEEHAGLEVSQQLKNIRQLKSNRPSSSRSQRKKRRILDTRNLEGTSVAPRSKRTARAVAPSGGIDYEHEDDEEDADIFNFEGQLALQK